MEARHEHQGVGTTSPVQKARARQSRRHLCTLKRFACPPAGPLILFLLILVLCFCFFVAMFRFVPWHSPHGHGHGLGKSAAKHPTIWGIGTAWNAPAHDLQCANT